MDEKLSILTLARGLAGHAAARQSVLAENIANADTPGYRARDIAPFSEVLESGTTPFQPHATRPGHLGPIGGATRYETREDTAFAAESPNGNTVSLEDQMLRGVEVQHAHDLALGVYRKSLDILRLGMGRR